MKEIDKQDTPEVSGGFVPGDNGCIPAITLPGDFPQSPAGPPTPDPLEDSIGPFQYSNAR